MKKLLYSFFVVVASFGSLCAQSVHVEKSAEFETPEEGWIKVLQLRNGNTMFFRAVDGEGIKVEVYDRARKRISDKMLSGKLWDAEALGASELTICALCEIKGEVVLFFYQHIEKRPLIRLRISADDGTVVKEDAFSSQSASWNKFDYTTMTVDKDVNSDCYAAAICVQSLKNIETKVIHFDGDHKKLNEAIFKPSGYKSAAYNSLVVDGDKSVYLLTATTKGSTLGTSYYLCLGKLEVGQPTFKSNTIFPDKRFKEVSSIMSYDHDLNKIQVMGLARSDKQPKGATDAVAYDALLWSVDPASLTITATKEVNGNKVVALAKERFGENWDYGGMPQNFVVNKDKTITVMRESILSVVGYTIFGGVGITELSADGAEVAGHYIYKKQQLKEGFNNLYMYERSRNMFVRSSVGVMSYDYLRTSVGKYVIYNDLPEYHGAEDERERRKPFKTDDVNGAALCFKLGDGTVDMSFLLDEKGASPYSHCNIGSSHFDPETERYACMITKKMKKDSKSSIAWISFK